MKGGGPLFVRRCVNKVEKVSIRRFQSLWKCDVELGKLTVIVGPSNSGKSAFGRALRTVARNAQGNSFVSHGEKTALVTLTLSTGDEVSIERGKGASTFRIANPATGRDDVYAKSGAQVPEDVAKLLATPLPDDGPDPHFTTQFDGPYLLNASGSTAAKAIGDLTNVTLLAEASREANRRRTSANQLAKTRKTDAQAAAHEVRSSYGNLQSRKAATEEARLLLEESKGTADRAARLETLSERAETAELAASRAEEEALHLSAVVEAIGTDLEQADEVLERISRLESLVKRGVELGSEVLDLEASIEKIELAILAGEKTVTDLLKEAGQCPTCLQSV